MSSTSLLKLDRISKRFGRVRALDSVSLTFEKGRIYGLAGANGAGKSTLVKILCGVYAPDAGSMELDGKCFEPSGPAEAQEAGLSVFHQEIPVCPNLSVAANVFLGDRSVGVFPDWAKLERQCEQWFGEWLGLALDASRLLCDCTVAERQMTLLMRALSREARLIILDEPTTALTPPETARFFEVIRRLSSQGITFLFVSHFLHELMELSDEIHVLRDGSLAGSLAKQEFDAGTLASLIAGRSFDAAPHPPVALAVSSRRASRLELRALSRAGRFRDVSFSVLAGEIVGLTGLQGSGRSALARSLFGAPPADRGQVLIDGNRIRIRSPRDAISAGLGYVPEDRQQLGLFDHLDVRSNLGLLRLDRFVRFGLLARKRLTALTLAMQRELQIRLPAPDAPISSLSGGNQQKVLMARWLAVQPAVLVLNEPTRGVDIGAKEEICRLLRGRADTGCALLVVSSDLDEILRLADRILVMAKGRIARAFDRNEASKAEIIRAVATPQDPAKTDERTPD